MPIEGIPAPKVEGQGSIRYRCASCHELVDHPKWVVVEGDQLPFHPDHAPRED